MNALGGIETHKVMALCMGRAQLCKAMVEVQQVVETQAT